MPTYASWINQVERWFGIITQRAIRRGSFSRVKELIARIELFVAAYNKTKAPFNWSTTADSSLEKLQRLCSQISGTGTRAPTSAAAGAGSARSRC
jgi:putative transposase